jgi:thiamine biosynthesis lipoprotein
MTPVCGSIRRARPLLGTFVEIAVADAPAPVMEEAVEAAFAAIAEVHRLMSAHERESDLSRLNRQAAARPLEVHPWTFEVLQAAADLQRRSAGLFDIAVPSAGAGCEGTPVPRAIELLPGRRVRISAADSRIDLGGIAKGFAVDCAILVLRDHGMPQGLVNAGGDLAAFGPDAVTISVRDPRAPSCIMCRVEVKDEALASSSRPVDPSQGSAVIDPRTGLPASPVLGATVCAGRCIIADALTKIVMVAGEAAAPVLASYGASALFVAPDGDLQVTRNWQYAVHLAA